MLSSQNLAETHCCWVPLPCCPSLIPPQYFFPFASLTLQWSCPNYCPHFLLWVKPFKAALPNLTLCYQ